MEDKTLIVSDIGEVIHNNTFYDYESKYNCKNINTTLKANIDKDTVLLKLHEDGTKTKKKVYKKTLFFK